MPNGHDRNWFRLCGAIGGFRDRHGRWPTRVRLFPFAIDDFRDCLFEAGDFALITSKIELVPEEDAPMIAEDDSGASYNYGQEGIFDVDSPHRAAEWFGVTPRPED